VVDALIEGWGYFDADSYADEVLAGVPLTGRQVKVTHSGQLRAVGRMPGIDDLWISQPMTDLTVLAGLHPLKELTIVALRGEVDLSRLTTQHSLLRLGLGGRASLKNVDVLGELSELDVLHLGYRCLPDLRELCLGPKVNYLSVLNFDASLDLAPLAHERIRWLNLHADVLCLPQNVQALLALPLLTHLRLTRVDLAAWLKAGTFLPPTVRRVSLRDCALPDDTAELDFPGVKVTFE
jgi:hypothetical protein